MKTIVENPKDLNTHETQFSLLDGMINILDEEEQITASYDYYEGEADSSHYSVGGDNGL